LPRPAARRVAVVGGAGFIGSRLASALVENGADVTILDLEDPPLGLEARCRLRRVDLRDRRALRRALAGFETVFLAAGWLAKHCDEDPAGGWAVNAVGVRNVVDELEAESRAVRVVFLSSASVYWSPAPAYPIPESSPVRAVDPYTASKIEAEGTLKCAARRGLISAVVFRPFTVYGPGPAAGARGHFVTHWIECALANVPLTIHGDGRQTVDLVHVDDLVGACLAAHVIDPGFEILNIGSGIETRISDVAGWMREVLPTLEVVSTSAPRIARVRQVADIRRARDLLGWRPRIHPYHGVKGLLGERLREFAELGMSR
jgi:UDP-glucose 4-epimerase